MIGKRERELLLAVVASENSLSPERCIPLYIDHVPHKHRFYSERDLIRWVSGVAKRGLVRFERESFIYSTPEGRAAIAAQQRQGGEK